MSTFTFSKPCEPAQPMSMSKCPVFPTSVLFFNFFMWSKVKILSEETKMSNSDMTIPTWKLSQHACKAQKGLQTANSKRPGSLEQAFQQSRHQLRA